MKTLSVKLVIDEKETQYNTPNFLSGKLFRDASEISLEMETKGDFDLDRGIEFVSRAFGNHFTPQQFEEGIDSRHLLRTIYATVHYVVGNIAEASKLLNADGEVGDPEGK